MFGQTVEIPSRIWVMTSGREWRPVNSIFNMTLFRKPQLLKSGVFKRKIIIIPEVPEHVLSEKYQAINSMPLNIIDSQTMNLRKW